jgi:UPF0716 protein FxsA
LFLLLAGALLLTPGLLTDVVALALLVPPLRRAVARASLRWLLPRARVHVEGFATEEAPQSRSETPHRPGEASGGPIIEGEFERLDPGPVEPRRNDRRSSGT